MPVIREVLNFYLRGKAGSGNSRAQLPPQQGGGNIAQAQKAAFAIANNLAEPLEKKGITKEDLWNYIKRKYSVESRSDMSEMQWTQLSAELKAAETTPQLLNDLCERIQQLTTAAQESEVPTPEDPVEPEESSSSETPPAETEEDNKTPF